MEKFLILDWSVIKTSTMFHGLKEAHQGPRHELCSSPVCQLYRAS